MLTAYLYPRSAPPTSRKIERWRERLLDEGELARRTVHKMLVALFGILARAKRRG
jgi:hypothetical protein